MIVRTLAFVAVVLLAATAASEARVCQFEKGERRWEVKNSVPDPAHAMDPQDVDLASLIALDNPAMTADKVREIEDKRWEVGVEVKNTSGIKVTIHEGDIISVAGYVYRVRCQKDGDYHVEIGAGKSRRSSCLIVEIPDPDEIENPQLRKAVANARSAIEAFDASVFQSHATKAPIEIEVTGQLFLDAPHNRVHDPSGGRLCGNVHLSRPLSAASL
jgi:hypothetical protein